MLRFVNYSVVFQEVPDEVTLAINISGCPNKCKGCHSPYLMENTGDILSHEVLASLLNRYKNAITCVCFMGGDSEPKAIEELSFFIRRLTDNRMKTAWYSGKRSLPQDCSLGYFDYIKLGPYVEELGGLDSPFTNQHFYRIEDGRMIDNTKRFTKK
jgi:anaerobic ribonucleoside-triphosphate reductase activating protein